MAPVAAVSLNPSTANQLLLPNRNNIGACGYHILHQSFITYPTVFLLSDECYTVHLPGDSNEPGLVLMTTICSGKRGQEQISISQPNLEIAIYGYFSVRVAKVTGTRRAATSDIIWLNGTVYWYYDFEITAISNNIAGKDESGCLRHFCSLMFPLRCWVRTLNCQSAFQVFKRQLSVNDLKAALNLSRGLWHSLLPDNN